MRELAILTFVTLDGVMQAVRSRDEDPSQGFDRGGWANPHWDEVMVQVAEEAMADPYDLLLGRKTYELFASAETAGALRDAKKYVVTSTLTTLGWENSVPIGGDAATEVARLKAGDGPLLQVHGSWELIQTLLAHDLVDELRLWIFPVVVGTGKRLFGPAAQPSRFDLIRTRATANGAVMCIYRRSR